MHLTAVGIGRFRSFEGRPVKGDRQAAPIALSATDMLRAIDQKTSIRICMTSSTGLFMQLPGNDLTTLDVRLKSHSLTLN